jgi:hypothetical protein
MNLSWSVLVFQLVALWATSGNWFSGFFSGSGSGFRLLLYGQLGQDRIFFGLFSRILDSKGFQF